MDGASQSGLIGKECRENITRSCKEGMTDSIMYKIILYIIVGVNNKVNLYGWIIH